MPALTEANPVASNNDASAKNPWLETPLVESTNLSKAAGCRIFLKLETLQPSGSFKSRGLGLLVQRSLARSTNPSQTHFYSSSGGNAGLACVFAANFVHRPSTVIVPLTTKPLMITKLRAAGASRVIQHGASWREADTYLREVVMREAADQGQEPVYIPPFDHPEIWEGHASIVDEIAAQLPALCGEEQGGAPDWIVCSCGGGGLFCGIMQGIARQGAAWAHTRVLVVNTAGADGLPASLAAGRVVTLPGITSQATSLGCTRIAEQTFAEAYAGVGSGKVVSATLSDAEAAMGCWRAADDERMLVELACGVSLAVCYGGRLGRVLGREVRREEKVVIVACGGSNVTTGMVEGWRREFGRLEDEGEGMPSDVTAP